MSIFTSTMKKYFRMLYMVLFYRLRSLKQFKFFCTKIEGMTAEEWEDCEKYVRSDKTLSKFFGL